MCIYCIPFRVVRQNQFCARNRSKTKVTLLLCIVCWDEYEKVSSIEIQLIPICWTVTFSCTVQIHQSECLKGLCTFRRTNCNRESVCVCALHVCTFQKSLPWITLNFQHFAFAAKMRSRSALEYACCVEWMCKNSAVKIVTFIQIFRIVLYF